MSQENRNCPWILKILHAMIQASIPVMEIDAGFFHFQFCCGSGCISCRLGHLREGVVVLSIRCTIIGSHRSPICPLPAFGTMIHGKIVELAARYPLDGGEQPQWALHLRGLIIFHQQTGCISPRILESAFQAPLPLCLSPRLTTEEEVLIHTGRTRTSARHGSNRKL